jgi:hypothetical protein
MQNGTENVENSVNFKIQKISLSMKKYLLLFLLSVMCMQVSAQDNFRFGLEVSPSWKINIQRSKTTNIRSFQSGYGFTLGVPVKFVMNNFNTFNTGVNYVFTSFDNFVGNVLASSTRFNTLQVPLSFNINVREDWFAILGGGIDYNFSARDVAFGTSATINSITNSVQPFLTLGVNNARELTNHLFEIGLQGRIQLLDIWNKDYLFTEVTASHLLSLDLVLRFYL